MKKINLGQKDIIHFIGIGGIGMSGLAQIMNNMGFKIQGSDQNKNKNTVNCSKSGIKIFIGHSANNIKKANTIVKSTAIKNNNVELKFAKKNKIPIYSRAEVLADVVSLKKNIIITGSHGKTTTTSLVAKILSDQKLDPTIINGGVINSFKNNAKLGKGDWAILEADESDGSFLKLPINYSIVTNIDYEHIDYYKNYKNLENSFLKFINKTPPTGKAIICLDNNNIKKILPKIKNKNIILYGESKNADYIIEKIKYKFDSTTFDLCFKDKDKRKRKIKNINVKLLGRHNVLNAAAAFIVCINLGANINTAKKQPAVHECPLGIPLRLSSCDGLSHIPQCIAFLGLPHKPGPNTVIAKYLHKYNIIICVTPLLNIHNFLSFSSCMKHIKNNNGVASLNKAL